MLELEEEDIKNLHNMELEIREKRRRVVFLEKPRMRSKKSYNKHFYFYFLFVFGF